MSASWRSLIRLSSIEDDTVATESQSIREMGFFYMRNKVVGERVDNMNEKGWPFHQLNGLEFVRQSTV